MKKVKDLCIILVIYVLAFVVGYLSCRTIENQMLQFFIFDVVATCVTFVFSVLFTNSSVYDAYWSLTPMVMSLWLFWECRAFGIMQILFLTAFNLWSLRLTVNWITVFTDFSYEDWRYRKYREDNKPAIWVILNFGGIHMMPTLLVFAGMLPLFEIANNPLGIVSIPGIAVILGGMLLQFFADRQMHRFLKKQDAGERTSCREGLWKYSRHPNYLGEILVWLGVYLAMLPYAVDKWYYGIGFLAIGIMFNVVSVPLMEKRQKQRRKDYADYCTTTHRLLLLPTKKK